MAPFFASNGVSRTNDVIVSSNFFIPQNDGERNGDSDPRSPLPASATSVGVRRGALALTVDTSYADEYRLAEFGQDGLVADEFRRHEAKLDEMINAFEKEVGISPALPSSGLLPSEELHRVCIPDAAPDTTQGKSDNTVTVSSEKTKNKSWRYCDPDESGFGEWPEKEKKKKKLRVRIPKPYAGESNDVLPQSSDITECNSVEPYFVASPEDRRELRICNPDPASGESSAVAGPKESHYKAAPESPFVDRTRPHWLFTPKVQDDLNKYEISYPNASRPLSEEPSPKTQPKKGLTRRPTVLQPKTRHSCYACQIKKEMGEKARAKIAETKKGKIGLQ